MAQVLLAMNSQQESANRRLMNRWHNMESGTGFEFACEARPNDAALKNTADARDVHRIGGGEESFADDLREVYKVIRRAHENPIRDSIAPLRSLVNEPRETGYARARVIFGVELPTESVEIALASGLQPHLTKQCWRTPLLIHSQRGAHRFTHNAPCAPFVAEGIAPATGSRNLRTRVSPHRYRTRSRNGDYPRFRCVRSSQRDGQVIRHNQFPAFQDCAEYFLLAIDAAGESQAGGIKLDSRGGNSRVPAGFRYGAGNGLDQAPATFGALHMVRLTPKPSPEDAAGTIADYGSRGRLAAIDAEVQIA